MKKALVFKQISSLCKVFLDDDYNNHREIDEITALKGERISYQILYTGGTKDKTTVKYHVNVRDDLKPLIRKVGCVPSALPCKKEKSDEFYLRKNPGLFPDVLYPMENDGFEVIYGNCHSLFITIQIPDDIDAGEHIVKFSFKTEDAVFDKTMKLKVINAVIPKCGIDYTQWLHADCIADYYNFKVFSKEHWEMIDKFIKMAVHTGITMMLTPVFTLPLDTEIGRERTTVQLVDVKYFNCEYTFGFDKLKKWIKICKNNGISKFEISHLFSQWGTGCPPKIIAETENGIEKIFGWHTSADSEEYRKFLNSFLPCLTDFLKKEGIYEQTYFHISDEPDFEKHFECYAMERDIVKGLIPDDKIIDAISHYEFLEKGLVKKPIVITCAVDKFFEKGFKDIWAYYCCGPAGDGYCNRFMAMPSGRNRIIGIQLYNYNIKGFLHWGFNFYYSQLSKRKINPFIVTDADEAFQSGDAFSVYPYENGPIESLRSAVFYEALQDYRACLLLENYVGRKNVIKIINQHGKITFNEYPRTDDEVLEIRNRINQSLNKQLSNI